MLYAQDKTAHIQDRVRLRHGTGREGALRSAAVSRLHWFQVSKELLERVFPVVYGMQLKDVVPHEDLAIGSFRYSVSITIPHMTQVALNSQEGNHARDAQLSKEEVPLSSFAGRLRESRGARTTKSRDLAFAFLLFASESFPRSGRSRLSTSSSHAEDGELCTSRASTRRSINTGASASHARRSRCKLADDDLDSGKPTAPASIHLPTTLMPRCSRNWLTISSTQTTLALQKNILDVLLRFLCSCRGQERSGKWQNVQKNLDALKAFTPGAMPPQSPQAQQQPTQPASGTRHCSQAGVAVFCENREECSLCKMPESALVPACCLLRPTGSSEARKRPRWSAPMAPANPR